MSKPKAMVPEMTLYLTVYSQLKHTIPFNPLSHYLDL